MKKSLFILLAIAAFVLSSMVFADSDRSCTHTGTWYGGSEPFKYQYTFIPTVPAGRFTAIADGVYSPAILTNPMNPGVLTELATTWTGEMMRKPGESAYEIRLIALASTYPIAPPPADPPEIWAVKGDVMFEGCDAIVIEYDWFAIYEWDKVPFVDEPDVWLLSSGEKIIETIKRMPVDSKLPAPPQ
jgi:hypothetical protein